MSDLTYVERMMLEQQFRMGSGYVLDFSDRTFRGFVVSTIRLDPDDQMYMVNGTSKANRLRTIWEIEPNHVVGKLIEEMLKLCRREGSSENYDRCAEIATRLKQGAPVDVEALSAGDGGREFDMLVREVKAAIDRREPEAGLDRLHTYTVKFLRSVAGRRGVVVERDKPLHSILGEYVKALRTAGLFETEMTERILKSSIGTLEAFNHIRNERSLAHDNPTLGFDEALLIFNNVCGFIRYVRAIEDRERVKAEREVAARRTPPTPYDDDIPF